FLPRLNFSFIAQRLQRRDTGDVDRSGLLKGDARRFQRDCSSGPRTNVFRKGSAPSAEDFVAWFELRYILPDGFNCPGKVDTQPCVLWFAQTNTHCAHDFGRAFDEVPVVRIDGSRPYLYQDLIVIRNGLFNVLKLEIT